MIILILSEICMKLDMMTAKQKTNFEKLFEEKKFYEVPDPIY